MGSVVFSVVLTVHVLAGLGVIGLVLMQHGKGADMGAAFSLFGSSGSANFMSRATGGLAAVFFVTSLGLSYLAGSKDNVTKSVMDGAAVSAPAIDPAAGSVAPAADGSKAKDIPR